MNVVIWESYDERYFVFLNPKENSLSIKADRHGDVITKGHYMELKGLEKLCNRNWKEGDLMRCTQKGESLVVYLE